MINLNRLPGKSEMRKDEIKSWITKRRGASELEVEQIPIKSMKNWNFDAKNITHENNYYFSIIGVEVQSEQKNEIVWEKPIILQKEVGELGFIIQETKILLQAKTEPGNVKGTQIGPTVQATVSNYRQVHGGEKTKFLKYFTEIGDNYEIIADHIQLEQGTGFMNKSNRNSIIRLQRGYLLNDLDDRFRWFEIKELLALLEEDYLINTDTRSVIVSCDWEKLTENQIAFCSDRKDNELQLSLNESYYKKDPVTKIYRVLKDLQTRKKYCFKIKDLDKLRKWKINNEVIIDNEEIDFAVKGFRVSTKDREVTNWDQPLVHILSLGQVILYCQKKDGILKFLLNAQIIIGGDEVLVWGPSIQNSKRDESIKFEGENVLVSCMQSDEGGRFYQSKSLYQIIEVPEKVKVSYSEMSYWASLAEIQDIILQNKKTTNELRSVLSLLLKFL